jgi:hypothetical protein
MTFRDHWPLCSFNLNVKAIFYAVVKKKSMVAHEWRDKGIFRRKKIGRTFVDTDLTLK